MSNALSPQFKKLEWLGIGLVITAILILLGFPAISRLYLSRYIDYDIELPNSTQFVFIPWAPQMIGVFLAVILMFYGHRWVRAKQARRIILLVVSLTAGISSITFCANALFAPPIKMISSFGEAAPKADRPVAADVTFKIPRPRQSDLQDIVREHERKVVKEGSIFLKTSNLSEMKQYIDEIVKKYEGYISNENLNNDSESKWHYHFIIRLPAVNFDNLLNDILQHGNPIEGQNITVKDVSEEYIDLTARIQNKKDLENRYKSLLQQAQSVNDMLAIEKQIGELRSEIESAEGKMKYLQDQVAYSTLDVNVSEVISSTSHFPQQFSKGLKNGWTSFVWLMVGLINIWPFLMILLILSGILRIRKHRTKKGTHSQNNIRI